MQLPVITCYNPTKSYPEPCFYILNRGRNSGKPLDKPCPNCFVVICSNLQERDFFRTICFGLHQAKIFHQDLVGSCVELLRIDDLRRRLRNGALKVQPRIKEFNEAIQLINSLNIQRSEILALLQKRSNLVKSLLHRLLIY